MSCRAFCKLIKAWWGCQQLGGVCSTKQTAGNNSTNNNTMRLWTGKLVHPHSCCFSQEKLKKTLTCSPLSLNPCGSPDLLYPKQWLLVDSTRDQRLRSPPPLWCFWWCHRGTEGHRVRMRQSEKNKAGVCTWLLLWQMDNRDEYSVRCTYFMRAVREIQASNIHSSLDHLL